MRVNVAGFVLVLFIGAPSEGAGARVIGGSSHLKQKTRVMEAGAKPAWRAATFQPASAMDGSLATAWCEGARGPGVGEWIEVEVDHPTGEIEVTAGFRKLSLGALGKSDPGEKARFEESLSTFRSNGRPALLELTTEKGEVLDRFQVGDRYFGRYSFAVRLAPGRYRLRIAQVHPGARFEDTCIAELRFHGPKERGSQGGLLPAALRPIAEPSTCRAGPGASLLPQEVTFLGTTVTSVMSASTAQIQVAVRGQTGWLLPTANLSCHWGAKSVAVQCVWEGEETGEDLLDDSSADLPAWSGGLKTSAEPEPRLWRGEHRALTTKPLQLELTLNPLVVTATREGAVVETAGYTCAPAR